MSTISRQEYLAMQQERAAKAAQPRTFSPRVNYFSLKDDGDEAIVRFVDGNPDTLPIYITHSATIDGKFRKIACLRPDRCPLCESGTAPQYRTYIKLVEYVRNDDGSISAQPKIWERPASYIQKLVDRYMEYGDLTENVFKIKRSGARGDKSTTYEIMFANPSVYNAQLYPKDFTAFNDYKVLGGPLMEMDATKMAELVGNAATVETPIVTEVHSDPLPFDGGVTRATFDPNTPAQPAGAQRRIQY